MYAPYVVCINISRNSYKMLQCLISRHDKFRLNERGNIPIYRK
nr:MAG TPA: hypothetical protein [Caudoviricetes sp.]